MISTKQLDKSKKLILLVEDTENIADLIIEYLTEKGHKVVWAPDFKTTQHMISFSSRTKNPFDLIITDFNFPHGDGNDVAKLAKDHNIPVWLQSGNLDQADKTLFNRVYDKIDLSQLLKAV